MVENTIRTLDVQRMWYDLIFKWTRYSENLLGVLDKKLLSYMKSSYKAFFVDIGPCVGDSDKIWTVAVNTESKETPLVLVHGMGAGAALWLLNFDALSENRPVYAIDVLGFGRSSRPNFSADAEGDFVRSLEKWRQKMELTDFILLGHSLGGFIAASYALSHPDHIKHLIMADPWGLAEKQHLTKPAPWWAITFHFFVSNFNLFTPVRMAGPWGSWCIELFIKSMNRKFAKLVIDDPRLVPSYIHQCNAQKPAGENAFLSMKVGILANNPMAARIPNIRANIPISILYGEKSFIESTAGEAIAKQKSLVDVQIVPRAGHNIHIDQAETFNRMINEICSKPHNNNNN